MRKRRGPNINPWGTPALRNAEKKNNLEVQLSVSFHSNSPYTMTEENQKSQQIQVYREALDTRLPRYSLLTLKEPTKNASEMYSAEVVCYK